MKTYTKVCPRAGHEPFFEISFCKPALPFLCLHFWAPGYLRRLRWLWALQEVMKREGMIVAILLCKWVLLITGLRILIRNFIPGTLQAKKKKKMWLLRNQVTCLYPTIFASPNSPSEISQPPTTTGLGLSRKGFLFSSLKKGQWISSFSLSPLESYDKCGRAPGESKYSQQTLKEGHWKFPMAGNGLSE